MNKDGRFKLKSEYSPAGDQPKAIKELVDGVEKGLSHQTLLGVTGSGKTFTVANVIAQVQKPTLVIAHNKTLAAQLAQEYKEFFPENAVHYFVSYYDYYQPEAYMPVTDTYIEKEAQINEEIDRLRHASTQSLLTRKDVIVVASVSCIYGLGSPAEYEKVNMKIALGDTAPRNVFIRRLVDIHFERTNADLTPGTFRALGNAIEIMPVSERVVYRIEMKDNTVDSIQKIDAVSRTVLKDVDLFFLFPAKHFITEEGGLERAIKDIKAELDDQLKVFKKEKGVLEYERLKRRTTYDLAMMREIGYCNGIENYSRHFAGKQVGDSPDTLLSYFPHKEDGSADFLTVIDESHVTVPQIGGMYAGDQSRKTTLVEHGFRLPSAKDNRPLKFSEFEKKIGQVLMTTATPGKYELEKAMSLSTKLGRRLAPSSFSGKKLLGVVEQVIRPTGLLDPEVSIRPIQEKGKYKGQIYDFISEAEKTIAKGGRVIATTLTKKMAEDLAEFLKEKKISARYLHSDIKTIERIEILTAFRKGEFDCLVGVNLLREGLDLPELSFIGILDADKEGFLRSETSLIQIIGRAARNVDGRVILYADNLTGSMDRAIKETNRRRALQLAYNTKHGITPKTIIKAIKDITEELNRDHKRAVATERSVEDALFKKNPRKLIRQKEIQMNASVKILDFETAAILRDEIAELTKRLQVEQSKE
jgi:excinuclease ABC subunit B